MSVSITHKDDSVVFINSDSAQLYFLPLKDESKGVGVLSTQGSWYVTKNGIDEFIAVLTSIRQMFDDES